MATKTTASRRQVDDLARKVEVLSQHVARLTRAAASPKADIPLPVQSKPKSASGQAGKRRLPVSGPDLLREQVITHPEASTRDLVAIVKKHRFKLAPVSIAVTVSHARSTMRVAKELGWSKPDA